MHKEEKNAIPKAQVDALRAAHFKQRSRLIESISKMSIMQLTTGYAEEVNLKNEAYYFLLEKGYFESFKNYCNTRKNQN